MLHRLTEFCKSFGITLHKTNVLYAKETKYIIFMSNEFVLTYIKKLCRIIQQ